MNRTVVVRLGTSGTIDVVAAEARRRLEGVARRPRSWPTAAGLSGRRCQARDRQHAALARRNRSASPRLLAALQ